MTFNSLTPAAYHHTRQPSTSSNASSYSNYSNASIYSRASTLSSVSSVSSTSTSSRYNSNSAHKENIHPTSPNSTSRLGGGMVSPYSSSLGGHHVDHHYQNKLDYAGRSSPRESPRSSPRTSPVKSQTTPRPLPTPYQMSAGSTGNIPRTIDLHSPPPSFPQLKKAETYAGPSSSSLSSSTSPFDSVATEEESEPEPRRTFRPTSIVLSSSNSSVAVLESDLGKLKKSAVSHLRTLSNDSSGLASAVGARDVIGMQGRKRLTKVKQNKDSWANRDWMDKQRKYMKAYEYLCHIGEAKEWIERCIDETIPPIVELEEALRNGIILARLVKTFVPELVPRIFMDPKLQFRHSDNIVRFFKFVDHVGLPEIFIFELTDLYEKKNIPKVIYCIHALSFLLFRLGFTDYSIGNLIGKLEFTEDELHATQRGLDIAGVSLPSFRGMEKHFEPEPEEPVETEEERIERELDEAESGITELQAFAQGALVRIRLGWMMEDLWNEEPAIMALQSMVRGMFARSSFAYRADMAAWATELVALSKGFLLRASLANKKRQMKRASPALAKLQAVFRGNVARARQQKLKSDLARHSNSVTKLQAAMRGVLLRDTVDRHMDDVVDSYDSVVELQGLIRGLIKRQEIADDLHKLQQETTAVITLQSAIRGNLYRSKVAKDMNKLESMEGAWTSLQAKARGMMLRREIALQREKLMNCLPRIIELQGLANGYLVRLRVDDLLDELDEHLFDIEELQTLSLGYLARKSYTDTVSLVHRQLPQIVQLQARARGALVRGSNMVFVAELHTQCTDEVTGLQACIRAALARREVRWTQECLYDEEPEVVDLQALARGKLARVAFDSKLRHYNDNMERVVKIQSFIRAKQQGESYRSLMSGKNLPVGTVKNFVHLLNDSNLDFDEEIAFERSRKNVVQHVRANEMAEQYIEQLDVKIGLLIRNKITLDEVIKYQKLGGHSAAALLNSVDHASADPFDLKALNKNSRRKLELYQMLFFALQTQPIYLSRLFQRVRSLATPERDLKRLENLIIGLFGYAQNRREEFYLLKLIRTNIVDEMRGCKTPQDFLRGNFFWIKLMVNYIRSPRDRKYLRDTVGPFVAERVIDNEELDLESNPLQIYRASINNEELRTGQKSHRRPEVSQEEAIRDPETRQTFVLHLEDLRDLADGFIETIEENAHKMPFGVRYLAQACFDSLRETFPQDDVDGLLQVVIHFVYLKYLHPVIIAPETSGIADRALTPVQKKNLTELDKVLCQVSAGKPFSVKDDIYLQPLNEYLEGAKHRMKSVFRFIVNVPTVEKQFDMDEFEDLTRRTNPTLYIKMADIFALHGLVAREVEFMAPEPEDQVRDLIRELGSVKNSEAELQSVSSTEINLTLNPRLCRIEDPESEVKALFTETKRCALYIIRVQTGGDLMEILVKPVTEEDELRWQNVIREETSGKKRGAYADASHALSDLSMLTYSELKKTALENILRLEKTGKISRKDNFQEILNAIATDIRTKHRRRMQRQKEIEGVKQTLSHLDEKAKFLEEKLHSYNDYIEQAMVTLQTKKGKKKAVLPFTRQYFHMRELQKTGKVPKFGSYKYSARNLFEKGVLISMDGYSDRQYDRICFTLSSDEVGVFFIEASMGSMMIPGASARVPLDDLLQAQFNNHQFMQLFEGMVKLNVNLFLHLLFKKFYRDE